MGMSFTQVQDQFLVQQVPMEWNLIGEACVSHPPKADPGLVGPKLIQYGSKEKSATFYKQSQGQGVEGGLAGLRL